MDSGRAYQKCPVCGANNDVSVYVSGQLARCSRCGLTFGVKRPNAHSPQRTGLNRHHGSAESGDDNVHNMPSLPGYEMIDIIGKGGMGTVYKARQISLNRTVAIKVLSVELASDKGFIERFDREASALACLSHPNIVPIIDKGTCEGTYYFVMDFVKGTTLREMLKSGKLPIKEAIAISLQICRALAHAHSKGVIHRDMKPENVLLDGEGNARIVDFGLADMVGHTGLGTLTGSGMAMGTAHYMAPEQRKDAKRADGRADIYSMGIIFYEMLTGEIPQGHFRKPSELVQGISGGFDKIVIKCLQTEPDSRYQSAEELAMEIKAVASEGEAGNPVKNSSGDFEVSINETRNPKTGKSEAPQAFIKAPSYLAGTRTTQRSEVMPISTRRKKLKKLKIVVFCTLPVIAAGMAIFLIRSCC